MKYSLTLFLALIVSAAAIARPEIVLIEEPFDDLSNWKDLSTAISWLGQPPDGSAWEVIDGVVSLSPAGIASVGLTPWDNIQKSRSFTALDFQFPSALEHRDGTLVVEFRIRWASMIAELRGEWNRFNLMIVHDYPAGGLDLTRDLRVFDYSQEWWGRPSYQVRIRGNDRDGTAMLLYGGGNEREGEFEKRLEDSTPVWWLPGFSSTAGGSASQGGPSPGVGQPFPQNGWTQSSDGLASTSWQRFRYVVKPTKQALYRDADDDGAGWVERVYMPLPEESDAPASAPLYHYFETFEGLRLYLRGYEDVEIDYLNAWFAPTDERGLRLVDNQSEIHLQFATVPGQTFAVETSVNLTQWNRLPDIIEGDGRDVSWPISPTTRRQFYRLVVTDG